MLVRGKRFTRRPLDGVKKINNNRRRQIQKKKKKIQAKPNRFQLKKIRTHTGTHTHTYARIHTHTHTRIEGNRLWAVTVINGANVLHIKYFVVECFSHK